MIVRILGDTSTTAYNVAKELVIGRGHQIDDGTYFYVDLVIAPLLTTFISEAELSEPRIGTLVFHPSPLPYGRGASAIRWAYRRGEPISGATWFWCNSGKVDSGDICEQEILRINHNIRPKEFYSSEVLPALQRTLERCLANIEQGVVRRIPQRCEHSSFDKAII